MKRARGCVCLSWSACMCVMINTAGCRITRSTSRFISSTHVAESKARVCTSVGSRSSLREHAHGLVDPAREEPRLCRMENRIQHLQMQRSRVKCRRFHRPFLDSPSILHHMSSPQSACSTAHHAHTAHEHTHCSPTPWTRTYPHIPAHTHRGWKSTHIKVGTTHAAVLKAGGRDSRRRTCRTCERGGA